MWSWVGSRLRAPWALLLFPVFALHPMSMPEPANPQDEREVEKEANEEAQAKKKKVESTFQVSR